MEVCAVICALFFARAPCGQIPYHAEIFLKMQKGLKMIFIE